MDEAQATSPEDVFFHTNKDEEEKPILNTQDKPPMPWYRIFLMSIFYYGVALHWTALLMVLMPSNIVALVGEEQKGRALSYTLLGGSIVALVAQPFFGYLSDHFHSRFGRRKPFIFVGTLLNCVGLLGMSLANSLWLYILSFVVVQIFNNCAGGPYAAFIPDLVQEEKRGLAAGLLGVATMVGNLFGGLLGLVVGKLDNIWIYTIIIGVMIVTMLITVAITREYETRKEKATEIPQQRKTCWKRIKVVLVSILNILRAMVEPLRVSHNFRLVFVSQMFVMMGIYTVQSFLQYYLRDVVKTFVLFGKFKIAESAESAITFFVLPLLVGGTVSTLLAGVLSDKLGRKPLLYFSQIMMWLVALEFLLSTFISVLNNFTIVFFCGFLFGIGYGGYNSLNWALATDVLPNAVASAGTDMGVWSVSIVFPQVLATPIAGQLLDILNTRYGNNIGYTTIFSLAVAYMVLGAFFLIFVRAK